MVIPGGWLFLMSEVPLYTGCREAPLHKIDTEIRGGSLRQNVENVESQSRLGENRRWVANGPPNAVPHRAQHRIWAHPSTRTPNPTGVHSSYENAHPPRTPLEP